MKTLSRVIIFTVILIPFFGISQIDSTLFASIKNNEIKKVDSLLSTGVDIHAIDDNGANALMWACYYADSTMVTLLISNGARAPKNGGIYYKQKTLLETPVEGWYGNLQSVAAGQGKSKILHYLIEVKKKPIDEQPDHPTNDTLSKWTALMHAAYTEQGETVKLLLEHQASVELQNKQGLTSIELTKDKILKKVLLTKDFNLLDNRILIVRNNREVLSLFQKGKYKKALALSEANLKLIGDLYGENHLSYIIGLNDLATLNAMLGKYHKALPIFKKSLPLIEKTVGKNHQYYITGIGNLGVLYSFMNLEDQSLPYALEALKIVEKTLGKDNEQYGIRLNNLATTYMGLGMYDQGLFYALEALKSTEKILGKNHPDYSLRLNNLSVLYGKMGLYEKELQYALESKRINENSLGKNQSTYGIALFAVGNAYEDLDDYKNAAKFYEEALQNTITTLGKEHPDYPKRLNNLGTVYRKMKNYDKALYYLNEAVNVSKNKINKAIRMGNLAITYEDLNDFDKALKLKQQALKITKESLGEKHPTYGLDQNNLGSLYYKIGDFKNAMSSYNEVINNANYILEHRFPFTSIESQIGWKKKYNDIQDYINTFVVNFDFSIPNEWIEFNFRLKELVASNSIQITQSTSYDNKVWLSFKRRVSAELNKPLAKQNKENIAAWNKEIEILETKLLVENKKSILKKNNIKINELKKLLKQNEAIIDFVNFHYYGQGNQTDTVLYLAYIIRSGGNDNIAVQLFEEKELEAVLGQKGSIDDLANSMYSSRGLTPGKNQTKQNLDLVWSNLIPQLNGIKKIYFSPTGLLNKINLGAIKIPIEGDTILASDHFELIHYTNFRSMIHEYEETLDNDFLVLGGLNYEYQVKIPFEYQESLNSESNLIAEETLHGKGNNITKGSSVRDTWNYLPGTEKEVVELKKMLNSKFIPNIILTGNDGLEEKVKELLSNEKTPRVLHFSTHGFFYSNMERKNDEKIIFKTSNNPMVRSGLILSGANYAWQKGEIPHGKTDDGILTALEVANLNLSNTELVILSACETGLGDIEGSEGVMGLQRAFKIAGARYIIMSLWQVPDEPTQRLMTTFYNNWLEKGMDIRTSFNEAQQSMRKDYEDPYFWAGFILIE